MTLKKEVYSSEDSDKPRLPEDVVAYEERERRATIIEGMTGTGGITWADEREESQEEGESNKRSSKRFSNRVSGLWEERKPKVFAGKYKLNTSLKPPDSPIASPFSQPLHLQASNLPKERYQRTAHSNESSTGQVEDEATSERSRPKVRRKYTSLTVPGSLATQRRRAGWEPGVNIKNTDVILNSIGSCISIVDYDSRRYKIVKTEVQVGDENNKELIGMLKDRPKWSQVRWVNVNGLSWEAISVIAEYYQLHRLAVEDMVDIPQRTKVDKYPTHTFCCFPLQKLIHQRPRRPRKKDKLFATAVYEPTESFDQFTLDSALSRTNQSVRLDGRGGPGGPSVAQKLEKASMNTIYQWTNPQRVENKRTVFLEARRPLAKLNRAVGVEQVSLFLTDQRTVISFFEKSGNDIENPLISRIASESTLLRESGDPAVLFQAVIDAVVDLLYPIINCYRERLDDLQMDAIISPSVAHTRQLHLVNSDLTMLRNSIVPITVAINSLREHAVDHQSKYSRPPEDNTTYSIQTGRDLPRVTPIGKSDHTLISELATMYLGDVADHTLTYTQDLDVMQSNVKSMIDLVFNTISIQSSDAVRLLSLVTVVFLPLSFLTGYFGMNFKNFEILDHSDGFYWGIAIPFAVVLVLILMWRWVVDKWRYLVNEFRKLLEKRKKRKEKEVATKRTSTKDPKEFA